MDKEQNHRDDALLWDAFRRGDEEAFELIYRTHSSTLLSYGKRICPDHDLVKDALQDVFVEIWKRRENLRDLHTIKFYLFRVMRNRLTLLMQNNLTSYGDDFPEKNEDLLSPSIDFILMEQETITHQQTKLQEAISSLPSRQREAIMLAFYEDFSNEEIAKIMGINYQSVLNHLNRAYLSLRELLTEITLLLSLFLSYSFQKILF
ncbi:RNA polymerase sigma factor, sigma-70 family [Pseudarcicella hirudinis]|uniref:RNA polymerase sigma factor, sigma-70 family n=1 Tax=Pseudarcicella hirudinis TaxID=1079859 RepID=A0A1I5TQF5_9BACT|nr:sigma-70 family RNA polymerase sigma factor [Pseudarcicella hirudinis]SFP84586.1 RNA polymerase sigma factor, sigma-70 family [Pseudarcicella hirudinis]